MSNSDILPRRLSDSACVFVGQRVATNASAFAKEHGALPKGIATRVSNLANATKTIAETLGKETTMVDLDRAADRIVTALSQSLAATVAAFSASELLPLSDAEREELTAAQTLETAAFPDGTQFLKRPYSEQYVTMQQLLRTFETKAAKAAIAVLHLESKVARVQAVTTLYGEKLGIGKAKTNTPERAVEANQSWHDAFANLSIAVRAHYEDEPAEAARNAFWGPYSEQVEEVRATERSRAKKRAAATASEQD